MNKYMSAAGLAGLDQNDYEDLYRIVEKDPDLYIEASYIEGKEYDERLIELTKYIAPNIGITLRGFLDRDDQFIRQLAFPVIKINEPVSKKYKRISPLKNEPAALTRSDFPTLGCSLYSYVQNLYEVSDGEELSSLTNATWKGIGISALSSAGMILLPMGKSENKELRAIEGKRNRLKKEIFNGNDDAYEQLTLTEMQIYTTIDKRVKKNGIYGVISTTLMPRGVEEDMYYCIGQIEEISSSKIPLTEQIVYHFLLSCCGIRFCVSINKDTLIGEPEVGRRFKGIVWMQSRIFA